MGSARPNKCGAGENVCPAGAVLRTESKDRSTSSAVSRICLADLTAVSARPLD